MRISQTVKLMSETPLVLDGTDGFFPLPVSQDIFINEADVPAVMM